MDFIPELNDKQLDRLSEFLSNFSLLVIASIVIPKLIGVDKPNILVVLSGSIIAILFLLSSLVVIRRD